MTRDHMITSLTCYDVAFCFSLALLSGCDMESYWKVPRHYEPIKLENHRGCVHGWHDPAAR